MGAIQLFGLDPGITRRVHYTYTDSLSRVRHRLSEEQHRLERNTAWKNTAWKNTVWKNTAWRRAP